MDLTVIMYVVILLAVYIYSALALQTIAKKTKTSRPWLAWIPIANVYLMVAIAKVPWWTFLIFLAASFIPFVGWVGTFGLMGWWWWRIAEEREKYGWLGLLMLIPLLNFIVIGIIAWSE